MSFYVFINEVKKKNRNSIEPNDTVREKLNFFQVQIGDSCNYCHFFPRGLRHFQNASFDKFNE